MMTQGMKIAVSGIALVMAITVCEPVEAQVSQMMRPSELGMSGRTGVSQQRVPTTAQQVMNKKPETNKSVSDSGSGSSAASVNSANQNGSSGILDTTKGSGGVLDLNQTTNNPLLDKLQEQGNAGTTQSGTSAGQSGSGTGTAGAAPSSTGAGSTQDATGVGPTKEAADVLKQRNQQTTGAMSPFAQFAPTQTNQKQNEGTGGSYFGTPSSMDTLTQMNHEIQEKQAAQQEAKIQDAMKNGPTIEAANTINQIKGNTSESPFAAFDKSQENTSGQNSGTGIGDSYFGSNPLKEMENVKAGVDDGKVARLKDDLTKNLDFWVNYGTDGMRYYQIEGYNTYDQSMTEMIITVPENDTSDAAVAYRNKVSEVETAQKEWEAAIKSGDKAQIKASEEKLNNLSKQAQESAVSYAQKNPDAIQNANAYELRKDGWETDDNGNILANEKNFEKYRAESGNDAMDMEGFKNLTEEINAHGDNSGQAMQDRIDSTKALEAVSSEKTSTDDTAQGMLGAALTEAATPSYNADGTLSYKFDPNNLNDKQRAILDRVDSWKKQNEKRKAAGQDPISFEDYVHRGGLSQDVVIYKEVKLPKIESMAGQWHQAVDVMSKEEKANRVSFQKRLGDKDKRVKMQKQLGDKDKRVKMRQLLGDKDKRVKMQEQLGDKDKRVKMQEQLGDKDKRVKMQEQLGDTGYVVKQQSESNERQVESNFK